MEAYEQLLSGSILELRRVRAHEEARLGNRVSAASERFAGALAQLQAQYQAQVGVLCILALVGLFCSRHSSTASCNPTNGCGQKHRAER